MVILECSWFVLPLFVEAVRRGRLFADVVCVQMAGRGWFGAGRDGLGVLAPASLARRLERCLPVLH